jgi:hypothetical protein
MLVSFYGTLREWMKEHKPDEFKVMVEKIQALGEEAPYRVMGDPYLHVILPLESEETQDMLVKAGKTAFTQDMGFEPKGFWLPETAVSHTTLAVLARNGYEYVVLRDSQTREAPGNPMYVVVDDNGEQRQIAVVHVDSEISGSVSFDDASTINAENFLQNMATRREKGVTGYATDTEFYGHHRPQKDKFLDYVTRRDVQSQFGFAPFDIQSNLQLLADNPVYGDIKDNSSWSCEEGHGLGRWTGDPICGCDGDHSFENYAYKRELYMTLKQYGNAIDMALDAREPQWRDNFVRFFAATREAMYANGNIDDVTGELSESGMEFLQDETIKKLYYAELARLTGMTSCFNFFGGKDRVERQIAQVNIGEIESLLPEIRQFKPSYAETAQFVGHRMYEVQNNRWSWAS